MDEQFGPLINRNAPSCIYRLLLGSCNQGGFLVTSALDLPSPSYMGCYMLILSHLNHLL